MAVMVDSHTHTQQSGSLPPELFFACWPAPVVLVSWCVTLLAADAWNFGLMAIAMLVGLAASAMSPMGLFIAIRAYRLPHPGDEHRAILFALIGNALVVAQVVLILAAALAFHG
jgi:hypothetical protein